MGHSNSALKDNTVEVIKVDVLCIPNDGFVRLE